MLAVAVYLVYADGPFIYDDFPFIVENEDLRQLWPASWLRLGGGEHAQVNSRPLLSLTLALNYRVVGLEVRAIIMGAQSRGGQPDVYSYRPFQKQFELSGYRFYQRRGLY